MRRVEGEPGFVLHQRPYRETSVLLEVFSLDYGRFSAVVKGLRGGGRQRQPWRSSLQPFNLLSLSWSGAGELKSLTDVQLQQSLPLAGQSLFCGFYLNEVLQRLLHPFDPHPDIFHHYQFCLGQLAAGEDLDISLRRFEFSLLAGLGFGFSAHSDTAGDAIDDDALYRYLPDQGFQRTRSADQATLFSGRHIKALAQGDLSGDNGRAARRWSRQLIHHLLGGRQLRSRELFATVLALEEGRGADSADK